MKTLAIGLVAVLVALVPNTALAQKTRVCVGEFENKCPASFDAWYPCGTSVDAAGRSVCEVHTGDGVQPGKFRVQKAWSKGGNRCGYEGFDIFCVQ